MNNNGTLFLPTQASTIANEVDSIFNFVLYTGLIIFAIVVIGLIFFSLKFRKRNENEELTSKVSENHVLEWTWSVIPSILVIVLFFMGFKTFMKMNIVPDNAIEIKTTGKKWMWVFDYPNGANSTNILTVPKDKPVKILLSSSDVIHSFYIPDFRVKMDALPNRYTTLWFEANQTGEFPIYCTEFCGTGHSQMIGTVKVVDYDEYETYLASSVSGVDDTSIPLKQLGENVYQGKACFTCHTLDGNSLVGPTFKGLFGSTVKHTDGSSATVDENYIRQSILEPANKIVEGFAPVMPTYQGQLNDREIDGIIEFIKENK